MSGGPHARGAALDVYHEASGRTLRAALIVLTVWLAALSLWLWLDAHPLIVLAILSATLPALWDFLRARRAWLRLDDAGLAWGSGRVSGSVALARIDHVRMDTRLDTSVRVRIVLRDSRKITLPQDALPPTSQLNEALVSRGVRVEKHHFAQL